MEVTTRTPAVTAAMPEPRHAITREVVRRLVRSHDQDLTGAFVELPRNGVAFGHRFERDSTILGPCGIPRVYEILREARRLRAINLHCEDGHIHGTLVRGGD